MSGFDTVAAALLGQLQPFVDRNTADLVTATTVNIAEANRMLGVLLWTAVPLMLGIGILGLLLSRTITTYVRRPISRAVLELEELAESVANASAAVAASSTALASVASQQAASLEETSSSLEEIAAIARQNLDKTGQCNELTDAAKTSVDQCSETMNRMVESIAGIKAAADETARIVRTIDEIAFQTNLLALNAAVEAARAGDEGRGFSVVAEEVRNLASRSAAAAKETGSIIGTSVTRSEQGVRITTEVRDHLETARAKIQASTLVMNEVTQASAEQQSGTDQVSQAVMQMNDSTQSTSATAEESAAASEELRAMTERLTRVVMTLSDMAGIRLSNGASRRLSAELPSIAGLLQEDPAPGDFMAPMNRN